MVLTNPQTFNPEILYAFDCWNDQTKAPRPHSHDFLEISILLEGEAQYTFQGREERIQANSVMVFHPGVVHAEYQKPGTQSHQLHIGIGNLILSGYAKNVLPNSVPLIAPGPHHHRLMEIAWQIVAEMSQEQLEFRLMTKSLVTQLLVLLLRGLQESTQLLPPDRLPGQSRKEGLVDEALNYLHLHYQEEISVDLIAKELLISPAYLSRIFKELDQEPIIHQLIGLRMNQAGLLLSQGDLSVKQVANQVGYQDPLYFSKQFKKYFGYPPSLHYLKEEVDGHQSHSQS